MELGAKIFVAGHRGLVGSAILKELQEQGYSNLILRTRAELDLRNYSDVERFFEENTPEYVFICAAKVGGILSNNIYRADFISYNLAIQNSIIYNAHKIGTKKLIFLGSSCVYPKNAPQPIKESSLLTGSLEYTNEPYAIAKIAGIKMCENFSIQYNRNFLSVMPTNLYGNNDNFHLYKSHVIPGLIRKMHLGKLLRQGKLKHVIHDLRFDMISGNSKTLEEDAKKILDDIGIRENYIDIWGSGMALREFMHNSDMAKATVFIMQNVNFKDLIDDENEIKNTHINIGYGLDISIRDLAFKIKDIVGYDGELKFDVNKLDGTPRKLLDNSKLSKLGFKPKITLRDGIQSVYKHYVETRTLQDD